MRITSKGQVTIPVVFREKLGFLPNTEVEFDIDGEMLRLRRAKSDYSRGRLIVSKMRGKATAGMSTEQIMAMTRGN
ncbi:MAG: AbrB/MazE/SpoVT family DNA-binding domain-containing protein [Deltaproteobacteria bacterium]|nr:AbrB/MazE/SpoVT family DNA-binding domain-containing protein [Deltaproteobacteria bacterium]